MFSRISYYYSSDIRHLQNSYLRLYFSSLASQSSSDSTNTNLASSPISHDDFLPSLADDLHEFRFSVAPMMGVTNRHQRQFMRYITKSALLYTEMVVAGTIIYSKKLETHLGANFEEENPVVLQLGGADPHQLATAASIAMQYGYERFNLNVGCPSDRVSGTITSSSFLIDSLIYTVLSLRKRLFWGLLNDEAGVGCRYFQGHC